jgi:hypothetical protein
VTLSLPPGWPTCGADNRDTRRAGTRCRAAGDGWGQRCRHHGGLDIPDGPHAVVCSPAGLFVWRTFRGALHPGDAARQRVSWQTAALLVESGKVDRGLFFGRKGQSLLRRIQASGIAAVPINGRARSRLALTQYAFRRKAIAAA